MYRSGSTWQYNVVCDLLEGWGRGQRAGFVVGKSYHPPRFPWRRRSRIFKSHDANEVFSTAIGRGRALAIYCERDLRDVVYSMMHKWQLGFDEVLAPGGMLAICLENDRGWRSEPSTLVQRYETIIGHPAASIAELARHFKITLRPGEAEAMADAHSLEKTLAHIESVKSKLTTEGVDLDAHENRLRHDPTTLFHWNHVRPNRKGWRDLATREQREQIAHACGDWLIRQGYETDRSWVESPRSTA